MNKMMIYANPVRFMALSAKLWPPCAALTLVLGLIGLYLVFTAPPDYQQGITVRILFVHVPAAWMAMMIYGFIAAASFAAFVWRAPLSDIAAQSAALPGIGFTFLALASGSLWGRPIWGHFWAWDARLVSVLILFFLYLGYIALLAAIEDRARAAIAARLLAIVGVINLPIIKFSVDWWNTLHQPASILRLEGPALAPVFLWPLAFMASAALFLFITILLVRMRAEIMRRRIESLILARG